MGSTEEKYAAPPPSYGDATGAIPPAGETPQTAPAVNAATNVTMQQNQPQVVYVQQAPHDPNSRLVHCNRCMCTVPTYTRTYYGTFPLLACIFCPLIGWTICCMSLTQAHYCTRCNIRLLNVNP